MERAELQRMLRQKPFQPFRLVLRDGRVYEIYNPRMNLLAESFVKIGIRDSSLPEPACDHTEYVRLEEIARAEPLPVNPPSSSCRSDVRQEDLLLLLQRVPCPLLRLHLTDGRTFEVVVTRSTAELLVQVRITVRPSSACCTSSAWRSFRLKPTAESVGLQHVACSLDEKNLPPRRSFCRRTYVYLFESDESRLPHETSCVELTR